MQSDQTIALILMSRGGPCSLCILMLTPSASSETCVLDTSQVEPLDVGGRMTAVDRDSVACH